MNYISCSWMSCIASCVLRGALQDMQPSISLFTGFPSFLPSHLMGPSWNLTCWGGRNVHDMLQRYRYLELWWACILLEIFLETLK